MPIQLMKPIAVRLTPNSRSQADRVEKTSRNGRRRRSQEQERDDARVRVDRQRLAPASGLDRLSLGHLTSEALSARAAGGRGRGPALARGG